MAELKPRFYKTTVSIESATYGKIKALTMRAPYPTQTQIINQLLTEVFELRDKLSEQENKYDLVGLKSLHILRELGKLRGEEFLLMVDNNFVEELPNLKRLLIKDGIDYAT